MAKNTEKIYLVASPVKAQEGAPNMENRVDAFHTETSSDDLFRDEEKQKTEEIGSQIQPEQGSSAVELLLEETDRLSASDQECQSRSVSMAPRSSSRSSCTSGNSCSSGSTRRVARHVARKDRRSSKTRRYSSSSSASHSRSRPRPRCHRVLTNSRCCKGRRRSPPRRYRARSRSYSPSYSPARSHRRSRAARSRSTDRGLSGLAGKSASRLTGALDQNTRTRSRSRSRSPDRTKVHLSLQEKRELLLIARANAPKTLVVEEVVLPAGTDTVQEEPTFKERVRPHGTALSSVKNYRQTELDEEVPSLKLSPKNKITFSIYNSVAKPASGRPLSSPEWSASIRADFATGRNPYGHWVPANARSFSRSASKRSATKAR
ncbi:hypothetical protein AAFF_G00184790 [Aldrovandia affinis]|uniref:Arginine/serine-rich protein 1 n=1 Tax=Aldrovandia affinis TaxID=143900 RepID=A0AAD7RK19_9TELE|nr:hypothetical protein AAFF_G00184790 [Aldrovandia affinis]